MKVLTLMNFKGGSAKTTTALQIGKGLEHKGYKVLYLDLDTQGNLSQNFNNNLDISIGDIMLGTKSINDGIQDQLIKYDPNLTSITAKLDNNVNVLKDKIAELKKKYDFLIIDTSPAKDIFALNSMVASDYLIVPTELDYFSILGLNSINHYYEEVKKQANKKLNFLGIVVNKYNPNLKLTKLLEDQLNDLAKQYGTKVFNTKIRKDSYLTKIQCTNKNIYDKPKQKCTIDFTNLVDEILASIKKSK